MSTGHAARWAWAVSLTLHAAALVGLFTLPRPPLRLVTPHAPDAGASTTMTVGVVQLDLPAPQPPAAAPSPAPTPLPPLVAPDLPSPVAHVLTPPSWPAVPT